MNSQIIEVQHGLMHTRITNTATRPVLICYTYPTTKRLRPPRNICMFQLQPHAHLDVARVEDMTVEYSDLQRFVVIPAQPEHATDDEFNAVHTGVIEDYAQVFSALADA